MGSFAIPIMGRTGFGAKYNLPSFTIPSLITNGHSPLISPYYIRCRIWSLYASLMCEQNSTNNCEMKHDVIFNSSMGLGLYLARISKAVVHLEEVSILYSLKNNALIESPSDDISELWPFINIKFGK